MTHDTPQVQANQRLDEWANLDEALLQYHLAQWTEPKRSTVSFDDFIRPRLHDGDTVVDLGCGAGAATSYLAGKHKHVTFIGIDYSAQLIAAARKLSERSACPNVSFEIGDWFDLKEREGVDGVISLQTLSWLPEFERPLNAIFQRLRPRWVGLSSLFFEGDISATIEICEHTRERRSFYNVYSLPAIRRFSERFGYRLATVEPFQIDIDIPEPADKDLMGTYTVALAETDGTRPQRLQISGPLLMNWRFIVIERSGP